MKLRAGSLKRHTKSTNLQMDSTRKRELKENEKCKKRQLKYRIFIQNTEYKVQNTNTPQKYKGS